MSRNASNDRRRVEYGECKSDDLRHARKVEKGRPLVKSPRDLEGQTVSIVERWYERNKVMITENSNALTSLSKREPKAYSREARGECWQLAGRPAQCRTVVNKQRANGLATPMGDPDSMGLCKWCQLEPRF